MPFFQEIEHAVLTDVGIRRPHNQDAYSVQKADNRQAWQTIGHIFLVCDGMGGHAVGEKASAKAAQEIPLIYSKHASEGPANALRKAFQETNAGLFSIGTSNPEFKGMGTTATGLVLRDEGAWIAHVGDSRAYRIRAGVVEQLTYDHSYAWELARRMGIPPEDLGDIKKNVIVRSLGPDTFVQVDVEGPHPLLDGDTFVLCSDGLSNLVEPAEIGALVGLLPLQEAAKQLVELANLRGGPDNITVLIVRVGQTQDSYMAPKISFSGLAKKAGKAWLKRVPWPLMVLSLGLVFATLFVVFLARDWKAGSALFGAFTFLSLAAGAIGLVQLAKSPPPEPEEPSVTNGPLNIYKRYPSVVDRNLVLKWRHATEQVKEEIAKRQIPVDFATYTQHDQNAQKALDENDLFVAFREQARALFTLGNAFNRSRHRDESFQPKW